MELYFLGTHLKSRVPKDLYLFVQQVLSIILVVGKGGTVDYAALKCEIKAQL